MFIINIIGNSNLYLYLQNSRDLAFVSALSNFFFFVAILMVLQNVKPIHFLIYSTNKCRLMQKVGQVTQKDIMQAFPYGIVFHSKKLNHFPLRIEMMVTSQWNNLYVLEHLVPYISPDSHKNAASSQQQVSQRGISYHFGL